MGVFYLDDVCEEKIFINREGRRLNSIANKKCTAQEELRNSVRFSIENCSAEGAAKLLLLGVNLCGS
ncbi:hypothetical protein RV02_GL003400 [Enterococcus gilvus]|nr:hypothetical protein RV02_GL003400 [Enterococcus gilvus]